MRLLIGTLYTIENEFDRCVESIRAQDYKCYEHIVIRNLPEREAHHKLYQAFMDRCAEFDVMIKVDADMVILKRDLFRGIVQVFRDRPEIEQLEIALNDWFARRLTWGLNAFRNSVRWPLDREKIFTDKSVVPPERHIWDRERLAPAVDHCPDPSPLQAFHYGIHKAVKVVQPGRAEMKRDFSLSHWKNIEDTWAHYRASGDKRLCLAVLGAELVFGGRLGIDEVDYGAGSLEKVFGKYKDLRPRNLHMLTLCHRFRNWGMLPSGMRRRAVCHPKMGTFPSMGPVRVLSGRLRSCLRRTK